MKTEYECTILDIEKQSFESLLKSLNCKKISECLQRRYTYDFSPPIKGKWIRLRTNGDITTLTVKHVIDKNKIGGTKEWEIKVSDFEQTNQLLNELGFFYKNYQENYRTLYKLNNIEIAIDTWPKIPTYAEIEGNSEKEVKDFLKLLKADKTKITTLDVASIYKQIYGIDILPLKELKF